MSDFQFRGEFGVNRYLELLLRTCTSGFNFGFSAFINGVFLGSGQGRSSSDPAGGVDLVEATYTFPAGVVGSDNVVTVVLDNTGIDEENWQDKCKVSFPPPWMGSRLT